MAKLIAGALQRVLLFFSFLCAGLAGCAAGWPHLNHAAVPSASDYPEADAVILLDKLDARFIDHASAPLLELTQTLRAVVLRDGGERLARVHVPYQPGRATIVSFEARTITPDGIERLFHRGDAADLPSYPGFILYSDERALSLELKPATPGTVVEYRYTLRYEDHRLGSLSQLFGDRAPTRRVTLTVEAPRGWQIEHVARRLDERLRFDPLVEDLGASRRWTWERRDLPALPNEQLAPSPTMLSTQVSARLSEWTHGGQVQRAAPDPRAYSAWLYTRTKPPPASADIARIARELIAALPDDPLARARRLYAWVRDSITYCAIEIGEGGWRPHAAGEVLRVRYGDCKDKANLLGSMLAAVGVSSRHTLVHHHGGYPERFDLESGANFNHAILAIDLPGRTLFADPTSRTTPFGALPIGDQEADLLPVSPAGEALARAPASTAEDNSIDLSVELSSDGDGLGGPFTWKSTGALADELRQSLLSHGKDDHARLVRDTLGLTTSTVSALRFEDATPPDHPLPLQISGRVQLAGIVAPGSIKTLSMAKLSTGSVPALPARERKTPLVLHCRKLVRSRLRVLLGGDEEISTLPPAVAIERPFGRYTLTWRVDGGSLIAERVLTLRERIFPAAIYVEVRAFFDEILAAEARNVTIRKKRS